MGQSHGSQQIELNTFLPLADVTCTGLFLSEALHTAVHKLMIAGTASGGPSVGEPWPIIPALLTSTSQCLWLLKKDLANLSSDSRSVRSTE